MALQSRCTRFRFAPLKESKISAMLERVATAEKLVHLDTGIFAITHSFLQRYCGPEWPFSHNEAEQWGHEKLPKYPPGKLYRPYGSLAHFRVVYCHGLRH